MKQSEDHMDELFRKAGENYPLRTDGADWDKVMARLQNGPESAAPVPPVVSASGRRGRKAWLLLLLLLLIPAGWLLTRYYGNKSAPAQVSGTTTQVSGASTQVSGTTTQASGATTQAAGATTQAAGAATQTGGAATQTGGATTQAAGAVSPQPAGTPGPSGSNASANPKTSAHPLVATPRVVKIWTGTRRPLTRITPDQPATNSSASNTAAAGLAENPTDVNGNAAGGNQNTASGKPAIDANQVAAAGKTAVDANQTAAAGKSAADANQSAAAGKTVVDANQSAASGKTAADANQTAAAGTKSDAAKTAAAKPAPDSTKTASARSAKRKTSSKREHGFYAGIVAGPDVSTVKWQQLENPGYSAGLTLGYRFNRSLSVQVQGLWDRKNYYTSGQYFNRDKVSIPSTVTILSMTGDCSMIELPVTLRWDFAHFHDGSSFFASAGMSSYLMKKEDYNYKSENGTYYGSGSKTYYNSGNDFFAMAQLSAGYTFKWDHIGNVSIEPYWKLPVKGMGIGSLPLTSTGIYFSLTHSFR